MKIGFDLDGVIVEDCVGFWAKSNEKPDVTEYVVSMARLLFNPRLLLGQDDLGFVITARSPKLKAITLAWCGKNIPGLTILFAEVPHWNSVTEWGDWELMCSERKAAIIKHLELDVYIDNNPITVNHLRKMCEGVKILLYGGAVSLK